MKRFVYAVGAFCAAACLSVGASAAVVTLTATGNISDIFAIDGSGTTVSPVTSINLGDAFSLSMTFDTGTASVDSFWDADPTINVYYLSYAVTTLTVGSYTADFSVGGIQNTLQLQNDVAGPDPTDAELFEMLVFGPSAIPVDMGDGFVSEGIYFHAFDPSGTARSNDLIGDLKPLSRFPNQQFFLSFYNYDTNLYVDFTATVSGSRLAVPEPASWIMMIVGFGASGIALRLRGAGRRRLRLA